MSLAARLRALVDAAPAGTLVPVSALAELMDAEDRGSAEAEPIRRLVDLTVRDVAAELDRAPSTVRGWLGEGRIAGAYRLRGREWRVPPAALRAFLQNEATGDTAERRTAGDPVDLGSWRKHLRNGGDR